MKKILSLALVAAAATIAPAMHASGITINPSTAINGSFAFGTYQVSGNGTGGDTVASSNAFSFNAIQNSYNGSGAFSSLSNIGTAPAFLETGSQTISAASLTDGTEISFGNYGYFTIESQFGTSAVTGLGTDSVTFQLFGTFTPGSADPGGSTIDDALLSLNFNTTNAGQTISGSGTVTSPIPNTPEPGSLALLGTGLVGIAGVVRRRINA